MTVLQHASIRVCDTGSYYCFPESYKGEGQGLHITIAAQPLRLTIDCGSQETDTSPGIFKSSPRVSSPKGVESLCSVIQNVLPKSVNDGNFILIGTEDQAHATDNQISIAIPPPNGFHPKLEPRMRVPKFKVPKIKVPKFKVPTLKSVGKYPAPRLGAPRSFPSLLKAKERDEEETSAERMERLKKGVQKMLHVVKVLGQIDHYLSERARIIIDILAKTVTEKD